MQVRQAVQVVVAVFGHVPIKLEPNDGQGPEFARCHIMAKWFPIHPGGGQGLQETLLNGVLASLPVVDVGSHPCSTAPTTTPTRNETRSRWLRPWYQGRYARLTCLLEPMMAAVVETLKTTWVNAGRSKRRGIVQGKG